MMKTPPTAAFYLTALIVCAVAPVARAQTSVLPPGIQPLDEPAARSVPFRSSPVVPVSGVAIIDPAAPASPFPAADELSDSHYVAGLWTWQFTSGPYFKSSVGPLAPDFDYVPINLRLGVMLTSPQWERPHLTGNWEGLLEVTAAPILSGPGSIVVGPSLLLRRNILWRPDQCCVPYVQAGAGIVYSDASEDRTQRAIGNPIEFLLQAQVGLRTHLSERWSFDVEAGFQHISNARMAERNGGVNCFGAAIGLSYRLPYRR